MFRGQPLAQMSYGIFALLEDGGAEIPRGKPVPIGSAFRRNRLHIPPLKSANIQSDSSYPYSSHCSLAKESHRHLVSTILSRNISITGCQHEGQGHLQESYSSPFSSLCRSPAVTLWPFIFVREERPPRHSFSMSYPYQASQRVRCHWVLRTLSSRLAQSPLDLP